MYKNVLVPVAIDHGPNTEAALRIARKLCDAGGKITALTVIEAIPSFVLAELPDGQMQRNIDLTREALQEEVSAIQGADVEVIIGHAGRSILEYAEENGVDCIVIASHQPGLQDYFLGSTAARVVRHAHCAVHVVR